MNRHLVVTTLLAALVRAQQPPTPSGETQPPVVDRVQQRAEQMREQIEQGRQVRSHVRVVVRLKNGNRLTGVVKDGRMVERVDGLRFVEAQARERGAGIRLWYSGGTRNYVFVPFADFHGYEVLQQLSQKQLDELELQMQMAERRDAERRALQAKKATGEAEGGPVPPLPGESPDASSGEPVAPGGLPTDRTTTKAGEPMAGDLQGTDGKSTDGKVLGKDEQERAWFVLLQQYPPTEGWNQAKKQEIGSRLVVLGVAPSDKEKAFVEQFAEWQKACAHFGVDPNDPNKQKAGDGQDGEPPQDGRSRRQRRSRNEPGDEAGTVEGEEGSSSRRRRRSRD